MRTVDSLLALPALALVLFFSHPHITAASASPASTWADQLWEQGTTFEKEGKIKEANQAFREVTQKYVGSKHYTESLVALGKTYLELNQPKEAIAPLEQARRAWGNSPRASVPTQLLLRARLLTQDYRGSTLLAREWIGQLETTQKKLALKEPSRELQGALLSEIESRIYLNQDQRAQTQLRDSRLDPARLNEEHRGLHAAMRLWLGKRTCERPRPKRLSESEALLEIQRQGVCLQELTPIYQEAIQTGSTPSIQRAQTLFLEGIQNWMSRCTLAPLPPTGEQKTQTELKSYLDELASEQIRRCRKQSQDWLAALAKPERPPIVIQESLNFTSEAHWEAFRSSLRKAAEEKLGRLDPAS